MPDHVLTVERTVLWSAGAGREGYALAGGQPDPMLDRRTTIFTGWACSCGIAGSDEAGATQHWQHVARALGLQVEVRVQEIGR